MSRACRSPIFIGGLSYSGKTQLRIVIGSHPEICMTRRTYMWERFYGRFGDLSAADNLRRCLDAMCADGGVGQLAPDRARIERDLSSMKPSYANLFALFHRHHADRQGARRWGDQLGFVERFADPIFESDPDARMVHMIRDPRDRTGSRSKWGFTGALGWETARWLRSAELARHNEARHPRNYLVVRYEELGSATHDCVREICEFLDERCTGEMEAAIAGLSFDRAEADTETGTARFVDRHAGGALASFGYKQRPSSTIDGRARALEVSRRTADRIGMTAWRVLKDRPLTRRNGVGA